MNANTQSFLGRYRLVKVLGQGAMGVVYEAVDTRLNRTVAIKTVLRSHLADETTANEYASRFEREAQAAARLSHPNVVTVYDFGEHEDISYIVMEFVRGRELNQAFEAGERFALPEAVRIMRELLQALDYAHQQGIVHRDVKPANVMLDPAGHVKLTDFGVARVTNAGQDRTMPGTLVGTPSYMSPEQILGTAVGSRADIFAAGVILYQFLTGRRPFTGGGPFGVQRKIVQDHPEPPSTLNAELPAAFDHIVARALAKQPEQRYESAGAFAAELERAILAVPREAPMLDLDLPVDAPPPPPSLPPVTAPPAAGATLTFRTATPLAPPPPPPAPAPAPAPAPEPDFDPEATVIMTRSPSAGPAPPPPAPSAPARTAPAARPAPAPPPASPPPAPAVPRAAPAAAGGSPANATPRRSAAAPPPAAAPAAARTAAAAAPAPFRRSTMPLAVGVGVGVAVLAGWLVMARPWASRAPASKPAVAAPAPALPAAPAPERLEAPAPAAAPSPPPAPAIPAPSPSPRAAEPAMTAAPKPAPARRADDGAARPPARTEARPEPRPTGIEPRCSDLLQRMQLGEPLTADQTAYFQSRCTR